MANELPLTNRVIKLYEYAISGIRCLDHSSYLVNKPPIVLAGIAVCRRQQCAIEAAKDDSCVQMEQGIIPKRPNAQLMGA